MYWLNESGRAFRGPALSPSDEDSLAKVEEIAEKLASSRYRFLTDIQIGTLRRLHNATRDEIRTAAIMADRIRRQRQLDEDRPGFAVAAPVSPQEAIALPVERKGRGKRFSSRRPS